jgi:hypothetical protein
MQIKVMLSVLLLASFILIEYSPIQYVTQTHYGPTDWSLIYEIWGSIVLYLVIFIVIWHIPDMPNELTEKSDL